MNYGIIAAGEGSRLVSEGVKVPKPLVKLGEETLIGRLIRIFTENNAESISIIVNEEMIEVQQYLSELKLNVPLNIIVKSTPSSFHSFYELAKCLGENKFCVTTVDTIFKEHEFSEYIKKFESNPKQRGLMAVTSFIDDEKPLYVLTDNNNKILSFNDDNKDEAKYISGGIYALSVDVFPVLDYCLKNNIYRMRNFQREIIKAGNDVFAYVFPKIVDVDHAEDINTAIKFLKE